MSAKTICFSSQKLTVSQQSFKKTCQSNSRTFFLFKLGRIFRLSEVETNSGGNEIKRRNKVLMNSKNDKNFSH